MHGLVGGEIVEVLPRHRSRSVRRLRCARSSGRLRRAVRTRIRRPLRREPQADVRGDQIGEEPQRAGAVGERMEHLQRDAAPMVHHPEQQGPAVRLIDRGAGGGQLGSDLRAQVAVLEVVPEHASTQHCVIERVLLVGLLERLVEQRRIDLMIHLGTQTEHLGIHIAAGREEHVRGVVQTHPVLAHHAVPPGGVSREPARCPSSRKVLITSYASRSEREKRGRVMKPCSAPSTRWIRTSLPAASSACA